MILSTKLKQFKSPISKNYSTKQKITSTTSFLTKKGINKPAIGIILGSGLGDFANDESYSSLSYTDIPNFPHTTVVGHQGCLKWKNVGEFSVVVMQGRFHYYEGWALEDVTMPMRVLGEMGCERVVVTNAAGGINSLFVPGDIMLIEDHINLTGVNPLRGVNDERFARFPDMTNAYDRLDRTIVQEIAMRNDINLRKGTYVGVQGPSYETPAEIRMLRTLGGDAVGMSTVPEVIVANHMNIKVIGLSLISNMAAGMKGDEKLTHEDVMKVTQNSRSSLIKLLDGITEFYVSKNLD